MDLQLTESYIENQDMFDEMLPIYFKIDNDLNLEATRLESHEYLDGEAILNQEDMPIKFVSGDEVCEVHIPVEDMELQSHLKPSVQR